MMTNILYNGIASHLFFLAFSFFREFFGDRYIWIHDMRLQNHWPIIFFSRIIQMSRHICLYQTDLYQLLLEINHISEVGEGGLVGWFQANREVIYIRYF